MPRELMIVAVIAFFISLVLVFLLNSLGRRHGFLTVKDIPCTGGIAIGVSFLLAVVTGFFRGGEIDLFWAGFFGLAILTLLFGLLDDLKNLSIATKFSFQALLAAALIFLGVRTHIVYVNDFFNIILTFVWLLWIFNAFNLLDVMDGLAAGTAVLVSLGFFVITLQGDFPLTVLSAAVASSAAAFFFFNFPPAKIYMGNSGSYFLGFVFGALSLLASYASKDKAVALAAPLLILAFPLLDTVFLVALRLWLKKAPFQKSADHICLRFLALGYSKRKTLALLLGLCLFFVGSGITVVRVDNVWGLGILVFAVAISLQVARRAVGAKVYEP